MGETLASVVFEVRQTARGLQLETGSGPRRSQHTAELHEWPQHLFVPRLFYLWALDNEGKTGAWAVAKAGELSFYLEQTWGHYRIAHPSADGHHWDLQDSGQGLW